MKRIKIGGIWYAIKTKELDDSLGETNYANQIIYLDPKQTEPQRLASLIHEILHCLNNQMSEEKVEFLAQALNQVIIDNKLYGKKGTIKWAFTKCR